jgi:hypothetical protein
VEIYYAQRDFWASHQRWASSLVELGWEGATLPPGVDQPEFVASSDGYNCSVGFNSSERRLIWRIRQDRLLQLDHPPTR